MKRDINGRLHNMISLLIAGNQRLRKSISFDNVYTFDLCTNFQVICLITIR